MTMATRQPKDDPRLARLRETAARGRSSIMCLRCGSVAVDQRFITQLACTSCGQTARWSGRKFTVLRGVKHTRSSLHDAVTALARRHSRVRPSSAAR
jgi:hypothetical protein